MTVALVRELAAAMREVSSSECRLRLPDGTEVHLRLDAAPDASEPAPRHLPEVDAKERLRGYYAGLFGRPVSDDELAQLPEVA